MNWIDVAQELPPNRVEVFVKNGDKIGVGEYVRDYKEFAFSKPQDVWMINGTVWFEPTHWASK